MSLVSFSNFSGKVEIFSSVSEFIFDLRLAESPFSDLRVVHLQLGFKLCEFLSILLGESGQVLRLSIKLCEFLAMDHG